MNDAFPAGTRLDPYSAAFVEIVKEWVEHRFSHIVAELKHLVTYPSLAFEGYERAPLEASADAVVTLLQKLGLQELQQLTEHGSDGTASGPAIIGRRPSAANKPTVLLYAHHDVQPVGDRAAWNTDPWEATEINGRLYGRGTADDKAGILVHYAAIQALEELLGADHGLGLTVFIEGEEEIGSPFFSQFLSRHKELLEADTIIVADSANWSTDVPALTTSLRGLLDGVIEVTVAEHPVHSGLFGGPMLDAITVLSRIIAQLHTPDGELAIPGLEQSRWAEVVYDEDDYRSQTGAVEGFRLAGKGTLADRMWNKAALNIIGIDTKRISEASNSIVHTASAKFSLRLGPGMDPQKTMSALTNHIEAMDNFGATVKTYPGEAGKPFVVDGGAPYSRMMKQALTDAWGSEAIEIGLGGSIPFVAELAAVYPEAEILLTGIEDPDTRAHAPNESLDLSVLRHAIEAEVLLLARMAYDVVE
ncbi:dipeptidase [Enteractinococcus fodinae]|uniref:Acetylornithine deacetylase/succinyl-diaminopimelate desuccinylase-like protein n=1 Tax=Enteractinococcus fodinae TaxID=684663 RepID=A0ABU2B0R0_9MICC|nr:M20/M25/M40 family metallo-hydrolase [Enteractinococcus fodinae]MDR7347190.1 acetylornithine deacetylase/succinyl-diaminopimelate desuccinylase-like protein [Enteractinococcus fodinae]